MSVIKSLSFNSSSSQHKKRISTVPLILKGKDVSSKHVEPVYSHKNTSKKIHDFYVLNNLESDIPSICADSYQGFLEWSSKPQSERTKILQKAAVLIRAKREDLAAAHEEIGGAPFFAEFNVHTAADHLEEYANKVSAPEGVIPQSASCDLALAVRTPLGPVYSIAPWNAPTILGNRSIAAPLAAGCSVVLKSSERSPLISYYLVRCYLEAGVPAKALQLIHFSPRDNVSATELIVSNKHIRKVNFTGSTLIGNKIAMVCAKYLKPYLLELGGKNYSIVMKDADIPKAIESILFSAFVHKGQVCMCLDKVFIHDSIFNTFIEKIQSIAKKTLKNPDQEIPQRDMTSSTKVHDLVGDAIAKGAKIVYGEKQDLVISSSGEHKPIAPIILTDVTSKMALDTVESFGPVLALYKYKDEKKLIDKVNDDEYGLKASIWSTNVLQALNIAKQLDAGGVHINSYSVHDEPTTPHGGIKSSGTGRFNSTWGIDEFSYIKTITLSQ